MDICMCFATASGPVDRVYLSAPIVAIREKAANLTAVVWPSHTRTLTFFWWFENSSEVREHHLLLLLFSAFVFVQLTVIVSTLPLLFCCPCTTVLI